MTSDLSEITNETTTETLTSQPFSGAQFNAEKNRIIGILQKDRTRKPWSSESRLELGKILKLAEEAGLTKPDPSPPSS